MGAVRALDPDILLGWEVQQGSLGYLVDRAALLELPLLRAASRTPEVSHPHHPSTLAFWHYDATPAGGTIKWILHRMF